MNFAKRNPKHGRWWLRWGVRLSLIVGLFFYAVYPYAHPLNTTTWVLSFAPNLEVQDLPQLTLHVSARSVYGQSFVNTYAARVRFRVRQRLEFDQLSSTLMASTDPHLQEAESTFFSFIEQKLTYQLEHTQLKLCAQETCWVFTPLN